MSLRPGIGFPWFQKYYAEVYRARDGIVLPGGRVLAAPRYYDKKLADAQPFLADEISYQRYLNAARFVADQAPGRLLSRELVAVARQKMKGRGL